MPTRRREPPTPEQKLSKHIMAMVHSEQLIRELVAAGVHSEDIHTKIKSNVDHLNIMFAIDIIANSDSDLTSFQEAVALGEAFILIDE